MTALERLKEWTGTSHHVPLTDAFGTWFGQCPDCRGEDFIPGPVDGDNQNVTCRGCGTRLNIYVGRGLMLAQRIGGDGGPTIKLPKVAS